MSDVPVARLRPLTVEEYTRLTQSARSKASWLLQDHHDRVEREIDEELSRLEDQTKEAEREGDLLRRRLRRRQAANAKQVKDLAEFDADIERGKARVSEVRKARTRVRAAVRHTEARLAAAEEDLPKYKRRAEQAEAELARLKTHVCTVEAEIEKLRAESGLLEAEADRLGSVGVRLDRLRRLDPAELDEGERNLLALDEELAKIDKHRKDHDLAA